MITEIYVLLTILVAFTFAGIRAHDKDPEFKTFLWFIVDFIGFPIVVIYEVINKRRNNESSKSGW